MIKKKAKNKETTDKKLFIDEMSDFYYKLENGKFSKEQNTSLHLEKDQKGSILFIDEKKLITHSFEEDNGIIENSNIDNLIETRLLKETQLDSEIKYKFLYKKRISIEDKRKSNILVYAIPENYIQEEYQEIAKEINYIDYITTPALIPEILYEKKILENDKTDIYIYFGMNYSFISIFIEGKYIYSKGFDISLLKIYESLSNKLQKKSTFEEFQQLLIEKGFDVNEYDNIDMSILDILINDIFHDTFISINQIITSARRMLNISKVDRVFIGTELGSIPSMNEYANEKLMNIEALDFSFTEHTSISSKLKGKISPLVELGDILLSEDSSEIINFTEFKRPPAFIKRPTSKLLILIGASISGIIIYIIGQTLYLNNLKSNIHKLEEKNSSFKISLAETEEYRNKVLGEKNKLLKKEKDLQTQLNQKIEKLKQLKLQISSNESITGYIINIFKKLTQTGIILKKFALNGDTMSLNVETKKHVNIGTFINEILETKLYKVNVKEIKLNPMTGVYQTTIKLKRIEK